MTKEKNEYYNLLPIGIKKSKALTLNQKNVLAVLIYLDNAHPRIKEENNGWFFQSLKGLEEMTNLSRNTILAALSVLEVKGYISRIIGSFTDKNATQYKVNHLSVQNDQHNCTETEPRIEPRKCYISSVENDNDNCTKDKDNKDKLNNNNNNNININNNNFEKPFKEVFQNINNKAIMGKIEILNQRIDKSAILMKDILEKLAILEKENIVLKNELSSIKVSNRFIEHRLREIEDNVMPKEEEYEDNADTNDEFSFTSPKPSNMTNEEWQKKWDEESKKW